MLDTLVHGAQEAQTEEGQQAAQPRQPLKRPPHPYLQDCVRRKEKPLGSITHLSNLPCLQTWYESTFLVQGDENKAQIRDVKALQTRNYVLYIRASKHHTVCNVTCQSHRNKAGENPPRTTKKGTMLQSKRQTITSVDGCRKTNSHTLVGKILNAVAILKNIQQFLKMLNTDLPYNPAISLPVGTYPKE